jgi:hypothetical protein
MSSGAAQQKYKNGINATTVNPMAEAASDAAMTKYEQNVMASVTSGYRRNKLMAADPGQWKTNAIAGAAGLGSGAQKKKAKFLRAMQTMAPAYQAASQAAHAVTGIQAKVMAAINALRTAAGKPTL